MIERHPADPLILRRVGSSVGALVDEISELTGRKLPSRQGPTFISLQALKMYENFFRELDWQTTISFRYPLGVRDSASLKHSLECPKPLKLKVRFGQDASRFPNHRITVVFARNKCSEPLDIRLHLWSGVPCG